MEFDPTCVCGRSFLLPSAKAFHERSCKKSKKHFADVLSMAKGLWASRKWQRIEDSENKGMNLSEDAEGVPRVRV